MTTEHATEHAVVSAGPASCWAVATDVERYPEWAQDIKEAVVLERNERGLASKVAFRAAAMGRTTSYTLNYTYDEPAEGAPQEAPRTLGWTLAEGDIMRRLDGHYRFTPTADGGTSIDYELTVELLVPIPGFVKRRAEGKIMITALRELRHRVESVTA
jgi:ribosome-associated toxin RatA of RatAB toxin-antitoxin module